MPRTNIIFNINKYIKYIFNPFIIFLNRKEKGENNSYRKIKWLKTATQRYELVFLYAMASQGKSDAGAAAANGRKRRRYLPHNVCFLVSLLLRSFCISKFLLFCGWVFVFVSFSRKQWRRVRILCGLACKAFSSLATAEGNTKPLGKLSIFLIPYDIHLYLRIKHDIYG